MSISRQATDAIPAPHLAKMALAMAEIEAGSLFLVHPEDVTIAERSLCNLSRKQDEAARRTLGNRPMSATVTIADYRQILAAQLRNIVEALEALE